MNSQAHSFIGRSAELKTLSEFTQKKTASLLVIKGRRRIGKSRLAEEFALRNKLKLLLLEGLAPESGVTAQHQKNEFARQMGFSSLITNDWADLFKMLSKEVQNSRVVLMLDEISWMATGDPTFLPKLKNAWDMYLKKNNELIVILCGSASSWIEENILGSTGFVGRISYTLTLRELSLEECVCFWRNGTKNISASEVLKVLSVTGGVPKYLEEINPHLSAEENIRRLCFREGGPLVNEFDNIFSSSFLRKSSMYEKIMRLLVSGAKEGSEIAKTIATKSPGRVPEYLAELEVAGFIRRDYTWKLTTGQDAKLSRYRLSDNYMRFYLKYIDKHRAKIDRGSFDGKSLFSLPAWDSIMALQFENLVLNNRKIILKLLGINFDDIVSENPYFQHSTTKHRGCQIDYMVQTRNRSLYVCEIKFSKNLVGPKIIDEVQRKIDALKGIKGISYRPVLIHVGGVSKEVETSDYFVKIIDFCRFIEKNM